MSRFKNITNPSKWKASSGDIVGGAAALASGGIGALATAALADYQGKGSKKLGKGVDQFTGKAAADEYQQQLAEHEARKATEIGGAQGETRGLMQQGRGDIQQGTKEAAGSLGEFYKQGQGYMGEGTKMARGDVMATPDRLGDLYGGGLASGFQTDPGYQFRMQQGMDAINAKASAGGGRMGGDTLKALMEHGQNFASNEFNNYANRQIGLAGAADQSGANRANSLAGIAQNYGNNMANMAGQQGASLANLYSGQGNNLASMGMQGAGINANLSSALASDMAAPQAPGPSGLQQVAGLAATGAGMYFGGPMGAMAANKGAGALTGAPPQQGYVAGNLTPVQGA